MGSYSCACVSLIEQVCAISPGHLLSVGPFAATSSLVVIITTLVGKADVVERGRGRKREGRSERGEGGGGKAMNVVLLPTCIVF